MRSTLPNSRAVRSVPSGWSLASAVVLLACAGPADATHYVVDPGGGGDFTAIQPAINADVTSPRDSILVFAGSYPETLDVSGLGACRLFGVSGSGATTVTAIANPGPHAVAFEGFALSGPLAFTSMGPTFARCEFLASFSSSEGGDAATDIVRRCTFHGHTQLLGFGNTDSGFVELHFVQAPLFVSASGFGPVTMRNCSFVGPVDTLVVANPASGSNEIFFADCQFSNAGFGVVYGESNDDEEVVSRCRFTDLANDAIRYVYPGLGSGDHGINQGIRLDNSRFSRCGTAVRWLEYGSWAYGTADTVSDGTTDAVVITSSNRFGLNDVISNWVISGCSGSGIVVVPSSGINPGLEIDSTVVSNCGGDGIHVGAPDTTGSQFVSHLIGCRSDHNIGEGFHVESVNFMITGCVAFANGSNGFNRTVLPSSQVFVGMDSLLNNTSVGNTGDGFVVPGIPNTTKDLAQNLSAFNHGAGFRTPGFTGSLTRNDAWANDAGAYLQLPWSPDSNLTADPLLCARASGDLTLHADSPCSPSGVDGLIGALPVGCSATTSVPLPAAPVVAFSLYPNPARGSVQFARPVGSAAGRIEVLDVQGRVLWRQPLRASDTSARWDGQTANGPVAAGLYWARLVTPGEQRVRRLVWIR